MVTTFNPVWATDFDEAFRGRDPKPIPTITVGGVEVPCDVVALPLTITHGRSSLTSQPDPPSLDMLVIGKVPWKRNDPITVTVGGFPRFSGFISGLDVEYVGQGFATKVKGTGWQAKGGAVKPSIPPRPPEDDVARVSAWLDVFRASFGPWDFRILGRPTANLVGQDVDGGSTVLDLVQDVCESTGALLWQSKDGVLTYGSASHRTGDDVAVSMFIDECDVLDGIRWVNDGGALVNTAKIRYGSPDADPRAEYIATDPTSIALEGPKEVLIDSLLAEEEDALILGNIILFRRAKSYWSLPGGILVRTKEMRIGEYLTLLDLEVSDRVMVRVSRDPAAPENLVEWVVEGWTEEWVAEAGELHHTMLFSLSDRQRFGLTGIRTVGELAAGFTVGTAAAMTIRDAMFKEII